MASAAEAELVGLLLNGKETVDLIEGLQEMGHPENEPTPIQKDNSTSMGIGNNTIKQRISKSMDMIFHWVRDITTQKQILV